MPRSKWLDEVALALRRQGLSIAYIRRFTDELADHCHDLCMEAEGMDASLLSARLGSPDELAARARRELRQHTYAGRHPVITFVAAPLPAAVLLIVGICLSFVLLLCLVPEPWAGDEQLPIWAELGMQALVWAIRTVPFIAAAMLFCHLARRAFCGLGWSFASCFLVSIMAALFAVNLTLPAHGPGSGSLTMGFTVPPSAPQLLQAVVPVAVWLLYARRDLRSQPSAATI